MTWIVNHIHRIIQVIRICVMPNYALTSGEEDIGGNKPADFGVIVQKPVSAGFYYVLRRGCHPPVPRSFGRYLPKKRMYLLCTRYQQASPLWYHKGQPCQECSGSAIFHAYIAMSSSNICCSASLSEGKPMQSYSLPLSYERFPAKFVFSSVIAIVCTAIKRNDFWWYSVFF